MIGCHARGGRQDSDGGMEDVDAASLPSDYYLISDDE
jgi:hypothetical protein